jgi:hypothetical protein
MFGWHHWDAAKSFVDPVDPRSAPSWPRTTSTLSGPTSRRITVPVEANSLASPNSTHSVPKIRSCSASKTSRSA